MILLLTFDIDAIARKAQPHDAGDHHQWRTIRVRQAQLNRQIKQGDVLFEIEEITTGQSTAAPPANRPATASGNRSSVNPW